MFRMLACNGKGKEEDERESGELASKEQGQMKRPSADRDMDILGLDESSELFGTRDRRVIEHQRHWHTCLGC